MSDTPQYFIFDSETIADGRLIQRVRYPEHSEWTAQETIAHHRAELMETKGSDFIPHTFQLPVSVAIAFADRNYSLQKVVTLDRPKFRPQIITKQFWKGWLHYHQPQLVTFNGRSFDLPVLELAAFRYGIALPEWVKEGVKAWEDPRNRFHGTAHLDVQDIISNNGAARVNGGLNMLATLLGKPGKMDTKGDMVQDLWDAGEHERIDDYCICDALDTYFVFLRTRVLLGRIHLDQEHEIVTAAQKTIEDMAQDNEAIQEYLENFKIWERVEDDDSPFVL